MPSEVPSPDYRRLFESSPGAFIVLRPDLTIVTVTDEYLRATMRTRGQLVGRRLVVRCEHDPDAGGGHVEAVVVVRQRLGIRGLPGDVEALVRRDVPAPLEQLRGQVGGGDPGAGPRGSPAGRRSASPSPGPSRPTRACCSSTSRSPLST